MKRVGVRRGGDVDLLILSDAPAYDLSKRVATRFFSHCEEKIDVVVLPAHGATPEQRAFLDPIKSVDLVTASAKLILQLRDEGY